MKWPILTRLAQRTPATSPSRTSPAHAPSPPPGPWGAGARLGHAVSASRVNLQYDLQDRCDSTNALIERARTDRPPWGSTGTPDASCTSPAAAATCCRAMKIDIAPLGPRWVPPESYRLLPIPCPSTIRRLLDLELPSRPTRAARPAGWRFINQPGGSCRVRQARPARPAR